MKISVVIPCYKSKKILKRVIKNIPKFVNHIILVDDKCPENTVLHSLKKNSDKRIFAIFNSKNLGVGGSVLKGYNKALKLDSNLIIKVDSDGQMDLSKMKKILQIFKDDPTVGYVKANRFYSFKSIIKIPPIRLIGNLILSILNKFSSGYWKINDPTNGYTAIKSDYCKKLKFNKIKKNFFFESDMLFHLNSLRAKVIDLNVESKYRSDNSSNLVIPRIIPYFLKNHIINFLKRINSNKILLVLYIAIVLVIPIFAFVQIKYKYTFFLILVILTILYDVSKEPK